MSENNSCAGVRTQKKLPTANTTRLPNSPAATKPTGVDAAVFTARAPARSIHTISISQAIPPTIPSSTNDWMY